MVVRSFVRTVEGSVLDFEVGMEKVGSENLENLGSKWVGSEGHYCLVCM